MATIKAPFNFVPLSDKVFFPDWAGQISQDVPFEDGVSGTIELKIIAKTPIFVRNGHTKEDADDKTDEYKSFSKAGNGQYFILGTSIKGAIRSVLEILSFGKMDKKRFQNQSFGIRDLSNGTDGTFYRDKIKTDNIHCGWLNKVDEQYYLNDCGIPWRISAEELDRKLGLGLVSFIKNADNFKTDINRTAKIKYEMASGTDLQGTFIPDEDTRIALKVGTRQFVKFDQNGEEGTIVFTGQPGERKLAAKKTESGKQSWTGKFFEFVFPSKIVNSKIEPDKYVIDDFLSVHKNSPDFMDFRKGQLSEGESIPVFFLYDDDGKVDALGLSYMFKYPAFNSIYNAVDEAFLSEQSDMADCIFGNISEQSLKGRVSFGHAFALGNIVPLEEKPLTLSSPNPSYYPLYLGNGQTWNSPKVTIAGRKRYPIRNCITDSPKGTDAMANKMIPLPSQTTFTEKIRFHNLRKVEVGALLSALLFHQHTNCFHNIGSGKPLGYGKVEIEVTNMQENEIQDYLREFENQMNQVSPNWASSKTINELFAMSSGIPKGRENEFEYMHMDTNRSKNDFIKGKDEYASGKQLGYFSQIIENSVPIADFIGNVRAAEKRVNVEKQVEEKKRRENEFQQLIRNAEDAIAANRLDEAKGILEQAKKKTVNYSIINQLIMKIEKTEHEESLRLQQERQQQAEQEHLLAQKERAEGGLAKLLEEKYDFGPNEGNYKVTSFKVCANKVQSWLKAANLSSVPVEQQNDLLETLKRLKANPDKKESKNWNDEKSSIWQQIAQFVGPDLATQWFNEIC